MQRETIDRELEKASKEVLVEMVKLAQKQGLKGMAGGWKEFLNHHDRKFGSAVSDPSKRSTDVLIAFLRTLSGEEDLKIFSNFLRRQRNLGALLRNIKGHKEEETSLQRLVRLTVEHPRYMGRYAFPSQNEAWMVIPLGKISKAMRSDTVIAVDCEMVLCEDGSEELVQVCAVDQDLEVKINMLVKPKKAIIDYRTDITGLTPNDLEGVTCSLVDAQKSLKKLLLHGTILAGHSLHNDLKALKIDHARVIDTSHIFKCVDSDRITPSLKDLCKFVLGYDLRKEGEPHDCLNDAQAVMKLILAKLNNGSECPDVISRTKVPQTGCKKLLVHNIPIDVPYKELQRLFSGKYDFELQGELKRCGKTYSTFLAFKDSEEAAEAFEEIECPLEKDTSGLPQKRISFLLSSGETTSFYIRRGKSRTSLPSQETADGSGLEDGELENLSFGTGRHIDEIDILVASMKRCSEFENDDASERKKMCIDISNKGESQSANECAKDESHSLSMAKEPAKCQCGHEKEIETLRQELQKRDEEISELNMLREELRKRDHSIAEIERLKSELKTRDDELFGLQKTVYDLSNRDQPR